VRYHIALGLVAVTATSISSASDCATELRSLQGTWVMEAAYEVGPNGARSTNYGPHPSGLFTVDAAGRYNMQIFKNGRPAFASGDKFRGTPDEYRQAVVGSSTHFGTVTIDRSKHQLVFDVKAASFPNWEGKRQTRDYTFRHGLLSYAVPGSASSSGVIAHSVWRRAGQ
jgi:hypothetical protein